MDQGCDKAAEIHLILVPHAQMHRAFGTFKLMVLLRPDDASMRAINNAMKLISNRVRECCTAVLLNRECISRQPELHQRTPNQLAHNSSSW